MHILLLPAGTVPEGWLDRLPQNLTALDLSHNLLSGSLPVWSSLPSTLAEFNLAENQFSGSIPRDWRLPDSLTILVWHTPSSSACTPTSAAAVAASICA